MNKFRLVTIISAMILISIKVTSAQNGAGQVYYFTLFPGQVNPADTVAELSIYTGALTDVYIEKNQINFVNPFISKKNDFDIIKFTAEEVQPVIDFTTNLREQIIERAAIKISINGSEKSSCFVKTNYGGKSDAMQLLDIYKMGTSYQVTNPPTSKFVNNIVTNFTAIVGLNDNTRVTFKMGGCETCYVIKENGGNLLFNQTIRRSLNEGDVWILPAWGLNSTITGSTIKSNRTVAVFSGSNMALNNENQKTNYTLTQELPDNIWGKSYLVPYLAKSTDFNPIVTLFTKSPFTNIFNNGVQFTYIQTPGGIVNIGYKELQVKASDGIPATIELTADTPFGIQITDPKIKNTAPFQLQVLPTENFSKSAIFRIENPDDEFVNIIYKSNDNGDIPDDLLIGELNNGIFKWQLLREFSPEKGLKYHKLLPDSSFYFTKNIRLTKSNTYLIESGNPIAVYHYGMGENTSFGYPVNGELSEIFAEDSLAPKIEFSKCYFCIINGKVTDEPKNSAAIRSNLGLVYMTSDDSYNMKLEVEPFVIGKDSTTIWHLSSRNPQLDSRGHLVFIDKAGNRKDTVIELAASFPTVSPKDIDLGVININNGKVTLPIKLELSKYSNLIFPDTFEMYPILDSDSIETKVGDIKTFQGFKFTKYRNTDLYPYLDSDKLLEFEISFTADKIGNYRDSLGFVFMSKLPKKALSQNYLCELNALIGINFIDAEDLNFGALDSGTIRNIILKISNPRKSKIETALDLIITEIKFNNEDVGFIGSGKPFEVSLPDNISKQNPLVIPPDSIFYFTARFEPKEIRSYESEIAFIADANLPDNITKLSGSGISTDVSLDPNSNSKIDIINESGILKFKSETDYTIDEIEIYDIMGKLVLSKKVNKNLNGYTIETTNFTHNVYIIKMLINGNWISKKVII